MDLNDDKSLFGLISKGSKAHFDMLFRKYYQRLVRFAMGYAHDGTTAEEIVQDVFVRLWENAPQIAIETSVPAYLYSAVRNHALNIIKHEAIKKKYEQEQAATAPVSNNEPDDKINFNLFKRILTTAVRELPDKCREIFEMAKFEGLTYDEIAEYLQVSEKTVENQMGIALKKLRDAMLPYARQVYET